MMEEPLAPLDVKEALYRIAQEALNNIAKHAEARIVKICLAEENGRLILEVIDDGIGFDTNRSYPGHLGTQTMKERTERVGGSFIIDSRPNSGTHIEVSIPVTAH